MTLWENLGQESAHTTSCWWCCSHSSAYSLCFTSQYSGLSSILNFMIQSKDGSQAQALEIWGSQRQSAKHRPWSKETHTCWSVTLACFRSLLIGASPLILKTMLNVFQRLTTSATLSLMTNLSEKDTRLHAQTKHLACWMISISLWRIQHSQFKKFATLLSQESFSSTCANKRHRNLLTNKWFQNLT